MSELSPDFETIFTREYWDDVSRAPEQIKRNTVTTEVFKQMGRLVTQAATGIFTGDPRQAAPQGTAIGRANDNLYSLPGTVLLTDLEMLVPKRHIPTRYLHDNSPYHLNCLIQDEFELAATPSSLFMKNSRRSELPGGTEQRVVYPYTKARYDKSLNAMYGRIVWLMAFAPDKRGETTSHTMTSFGKDSEDPVVGHIPSLRHLLAPALPPMVVGESYRVPGKRQFMRLRSAEICLSGTIEYASAKKRSRRIISLGRRPATVKPQVV